MPTMPNLRWHTSTSTGTQWITSSVTASPITINAATTPLAMPEELWITTVARAVPLAELPVDFDFYAQGTPQYYKLDAPGITHRDSTLFYTTLSMAKNKARALFLAHPRMPHVEVVSLPGFVLVGSYVPNNDREHPLWVTGARHALVPSEQA